jgi:PIN domain nuclease of toxin-antitoxin system
VTYAADTCAIIWFANANSMLSQRAREILEHPDTKILVSAATVWEVALKYSRGKFTEVELKDLEGLFAVIFNDYEFELLPIELHHLLVLKRAYATPSAHKDPFDRLIAAQCLSENLPLITSDEAFDADGVKRVW